ncbi:ABC transporter permease [Methylocella sp. CPCC 101449]|nr:ABC transporter permease [Methylocella sp. CPCC 101449]
MLRDIRTRMFGSSLGFIIVIVWPLSHILILVAIHSLLGHMAPYGSSTPLWVATGTVPFMVFSYMSRFMMLSVVQNKPLLYFPVISVTDILFARAIVEILSSSTVIMFVILILITVGVDVYPMELSTVVTAVLVSALLGLGVGVLNGVIAAFVPAWVTGYTLLVILLWAASGIMFVPSHLPQQVQTVLYFHPVLHTIEWVRSGYYDGYNSDILDKWYPIIFGTCALMLGLVAERVFRGKII